VTSLAAEQGGEDGRGAGTKTQRGTRGVGASALRIIGIDPGLASVGWGILEYNARRLRHLDHGCIVTHKDQPTGARLLDIFSAVSALIEEWKPVSAGMESLYFWKNVSSALPVAEAKGVIRLAFAQARIELVEYSPTAIKQAVSGSARAEKEQVQEMVRIILGLTTVPRPDHAADALAAAICRANNDGPLTGGSLCPTMSSPRSSSSSARTRRSSKSA
jgi:crossover junction endodeoxyribonuclease RuvC